MKVLVANLGSTSFKYRLFDMLPEQSGEPARQLARGGVERIGSAISPCTVEIGDYQVCAGNAGAASWCGGSRLYSAIDRSAAWLFGQPRGDIGDWIQSRAWWSTARRVSHHRRSARRDGGSQLGGSSPQSALPGSHAATGGYRARHSAGSGL